MYSLSMKGLRALKALEGSKKLAYKDSADLLTIGVGHLLTKDELETGILEATGSMWKLGLSDLEMLAVLAADVQAPVAALNSYFPALRLHQFEFDALVCFVFNIGLGAFHKSTAFHLLEAGQLDTIPHELRKWIRAGGKIVQGLVNRREAECRMWSEGAYP